MMAALVRRNKSWWCWQPANNQMHICFDLIKYYCFVLFLQLSSSFRQDLILWSRRQRYARQRSQDGDIQGWCSLCSVSFSCLVQIVWILWLLLTITTLRAAAFDSNVASKWGLTKANYVQFSKVYDALNSQGLKILAFPCNQFGAQEPVRIFVTEYFTEWCNLWILMFSASHMLTFCTITY